MTKVFVYGTLKRGHGNWHRLLNDRSKFLGEAVSVGANYVMLDGGFPRVLDNATNGHPIFGELFEVGPAVLKQLDRLEGHPQWYCRKRRKFRMADGSKHQAWVYIMQSQPGHDAPMALERVVKPVRGTLAWHYQPAQTTPELESC